MAAGFAAATSALGLLLAALVLPACKEERPGTLLASAREHLARHDGRAALIQAKNALQKQPDSAEGRFLLATALLEVGDPAGAEAEARKALDLKYPADRAVPLVARALLAQGKGDRALAEFSGFEPAAPEDRAALRTVLGLAHAAGGRVREAEAAFAAALEARPGYGPARVAQARLKAAGRDPAGALALLDAALEVAPGDPEAWKLKGDILNFLGRGEDAPAAYRRALEVRPGFVPAQGALVAALTDQGKVAEAARELESLKKAAPRDFLVRYLEVLVAFRKGDYEAAHDRVQPLLQARPDNARILQLAGAVEYRRQDWRRAESHLAKALAADPALPLARRLLVSAYLQDGRPGKALAALRPVLDRIGNDAPMLALAGQAHLESGDVRTAEQYLSRAAALDTENAGRRTSPARPAGGQADAGLGELERIAAADPGTVADLALIASLLARREWDRALQAIAALEKKQPGQPLVHDLRGRVLAAQGKREEARRSFGQAVAVRPGYFPAVAALAALDLAEGRPEEARKRFEALIAADPGNVQSFLALADLRRQGGGKTEEVAALLARAVAAAPSEPDPRIALIDHYLRAGDSARALSAARDAAAALPDSPEVINALGIALQAAKDIHQALAAYGKLAVLTPESPLPRLRMAEIHLLAGKLEDARLNLEKALEIQPDDPAALNNLAWVAGRLRDPRALEYAEKAHRLAPGRPAVMDTLAMLLLDKGETRRAVDLLRRAAEAAPGAPEIRLNLAKALIRSGDRAAARRELEQLNRQGGDFPGRNEIPQLMSRV